LLAVAFLIRFATLWFGVLLGLASLAIQHAQGAPSGLPASRRPSTAHIDG